MENEKVIADAESAEIPLKNGDAELPQLLNESIATVAAAEEAYRKKSSLWVMYLTMMFTMISIAIAISSTWPYLQKIEPTISPNFLGWANFGFNAGAIIGDLIFGRWMIARPTREPIIASLVIMVASGLLYAYAQSLGRFNGPIAIFICRVLLGFTRGNMTCTRSVVSEVTTIAERSVAMANLVIAMTVGFSLGSGIQTAMVQIGEKGFYISALRMHLDLYTVPAYMVVLFGIINIIIVLKFIKPRPKQQQIKGSHSDAEKSTKSNILACVCLVFMFSLVNFSLSAMETLMVPFVQHQFGLTRSRALFIAGMVFTGQGLVGIGQMIGIKYLTKRFKDRTLLAVAFTLVALCFFMYIPMSSTPLRVTESIRYNGTFNNSTRPVTPDEIVGCPAKYDWCKSSTQVAMPKYFTGALFFGMGYSVCLGLVISLFTKLVGKSRQGISVSIISAFGNVGRLTAPIIGSESYVSIGPRYTFLWILLLLVSAIFFFIANFRNLKVSKTFELADKDDKNGKLLEETKGDDKDDSVMYVTPM